MDLGEGTPTGKWFSYYKNRAFLQGVDLIYQTYGALESKVYLSEKTGNASQTNCEACSRSCLEHMFTVVTLR